MANVLSPFGAQDFVHQGGSQRTEELATVWIASSDPTPIFHGDLVTTYNPTAALLTGGAGPYITQGTSQTGSAWKGVFRGCKYFNAALGRMIDSKFWPGSGVAGTSSASGDIRAYIITDPAYRMQIQGSSLGVLGSSNIGQAVSVTVNGAGGTPSSAGGNTATGLSGMQVGSSGSASIAGASSVSVFPFRLVDLLSNTAPGNPFMAAPGVGSSMAQVNGADNTTPGQIFIVEPLNWESKQV